MGTFNFGNIDKFMLFGGGRFLLHMAQKLIKDGYEVIVYSADRHLNQDIEGKTLSKWLQESNIAYHESKDINKDNAVLKEISETTIGLSSGAAWIFKSDLIGHFNGKLINIHGTRLPQNRGGGGFTWQILRQNRLGYCLIHQIDPGIDTGNIIKYKEFIYPASCKRPADFSDYHVNLNKAFLDEFVSEVRDKKDFEYISQPEYLSIYWPRLNTLRHGFIDWSWSLKNIECFINAFDEPYVGASTFILGKRVFLKDCYADYNDGPFHPFQTGFIYRKGENTLFVAANEGTLIVNKVLDENGNDIIKEMKVGERFFTGMEHLESAKQFKAVYTPSGLKDK